MTKRVGNGLNEPGENFIGTRVGIRGKEGSIIENMFA